MPQPQQSPPSPPKAAVSAARICSVILVFLAMLTAATAPMQVSWLWLLLPLIFLAYLDLSSSGPSLIAALVAPQTWLFYGGLVAVALAFEFGGLKQARTNAPPGLASNSIPNPGAMPPRFPTASPSQRPTNPTWPNTSSPNAPVTASARPPAMPVRPGGNAAPFPGASPGRTPVPSQLQFKPPQTVPGPGAQAIPPSPAGSAKPIPSVAPAVPAPNSDATGPAKKG